MRPRYGAEGFSNRLGEALILSVAFPRRFLRNVDAPPTFGLEREDFRGNRLTSEGTRSVRGARNERGTSIRQTNVPGPGLSSRDIGGRFVLQQVVGILCAGHAQADTRSDIGADIL